jgi:hypothetical protein
MTDLETKLRESDVIARIEGLELELRELRRKVEHAPHAADRRVLNRQMAELQQEIEVLRRKLR